MSETEALKWITITLVLWYTAGSTLVLYLGQRFTLFGLKAKTTAILWATYLVVSRPIQLWILLFDPFHDDAGHIWFLAIDILALMTAITLFAKPRWYKTLAISLGATLAGIGAVLIVIGLHFDPFDLGKYVH